MTDEKNEKKSSRIGPPNPPNDRDQQFAFLIQCAGDKNEMEKWNEWRENFPNAKINFNNRVLSKKNLDGANLSGANLSGATLSDVELKDAKLNNTNLSRATIDAANLSYAHCSGTDFRGAKLSSIHFVGATFHKIKIDLNTDFSTTNLDSALIQSGIRQLIEYVNRRRRWEDWCGNNGCKGWLVSKFWYFSDFGRSTGRIMFFFTAFSLIFGFLFWGWGWLHHYNFCQIEPPVDGLFLEKKTIGNWVLGGGGNIEFSKVSDASCGLAFTRALYFSVVTMTTLGFGDWHANPNGYSGHILLSIQVILGYALLGALVTRFAILFAADGPEAKEVLEPEETLWRKFKKMFVSIARRVLRLGFLVLFALCTSALVLFCMILVSGICRF